MAAINSHGAPSCPARLSLPAKRLVLLSFIIETGAMCALLAVQFRGIRLGASPSELGVLFAASFFIFPIVCVMSGHLSDRFGRRFMTVVATAVCTLAWFGMAFAGTVWQLLVPALMSGLGLALIWPPIEAWLADLSGDSARLLNRTLGLFNMAWTAGTMVGPLVAGYLWNPMHGETVFMVAGMMGLSCLIGAIITPTAPPAEAQLVPPEHVVPSRVRTLLYIAWFGLVGCAFASGTTGGCFPNLGESLHYSKPLVGYLLFTTGAGQFVAFLVMRIAPSWQYKLPPLYVAVAMSALAMLAGMLTDNAWVFALSLFISGAALGVTFMAGITYALQLGPEGRGKRVGLHEGIMGIGIVSGSFLGGQVAQRLDLHAPFGLAALLFVVGGLGQMVVWLLPKRRVSSRML